MAIISGYRFRFDGAGRAYDGLARRTDLDLVGKPDSVLPTTSLDVPLPSVAPPKEGHKDDIGKERFDLIPPEFLFGTAKVLSFGAAKYSERNWEHGMSWGRCFGALMRHMWAWWGGSGPTTKSFLFGDLDAETGFSHLWHAGCCLAFLTAYEERGSGTDDRWAPPK
jgi:hypothetical protein